MLRIALLCSLFSFSLLAQAAETYNRVDFSVEAARTVPNDLLQATLTVELQDRDADQVEEQLTTKLNEALKQASRFPGVKASSGNRNTYPVYGKNRRIDTWRGRGEIRLQSRDFKAAAKLIAELQGSLQLNGLQFSVAPETRAQFEDALITEAIKAFRQRADLVRSVVGAKAYRTVHFSISSNDMPRPFLLAQARGAMAESAMPPPEFAGGESRMAIQISGTIELH